jgi:hypothetical protein
MPKFYRIRNWRKYQHYGKRNPPWIKLHTKILNSTDWLLASESGKLRLICCLLAAALHDGCVPTDGKLLAKMCRLRQKLNLQPLVDSGFLVENASTMLASASTKTESETETDKYTEERQRHIPRAPRAVKEKPADGDFERFWAAYPRHVGKPKARQAFQTAMAKTSIDEILAALSWQIKTWRDPQYIPHPTTWLNRESWADEKTLFNGKEGGNGRHETTAERFDRLTRAVEQHEANQGSGRTDFDD